MMNNREELLAKIKKIKALADRGAPGERDAAAAILDGFMKRHGITEADIEEEHRETAWFRFKTPLEERLLNQVIFSVMGYCTTYSRTRGDYNRKHKVVGVKCTAAERMEIEFCFEFYNAALQEELKRFFSAFVAKNDIYPSSDKVTPGESKLTLEEIQKIRSMMNGMDEHTRRKMIESGADA